MSSYHKTHENDGVSVRIFKLKCQAIIKLMKMMVDQCEYSNLNSSYHKIHEEMMVHQ